jgi:hypothetical protein
MRRSYTPGYGHPDRPVVSFATWNRKFLEVSGDMDRTVRYLKRFLESALVPPNTKRAGPIISQQPGFADFIDCMIGFMTNTTGNTNTTYKLAGKNIESLAALCGFRCLRPGLLDALASRAMKWSPLGCFAKIANTHAGKNAIASSDAALIRILNKAIKHHELPDRQAVELLTDLCRKDRDGTRTPVRVQKGRGRRGVILTLPSFARSQRVCQPRLISALCKNIAFDIKRWKENPEDAVPEDAKNAVTLLLCMADAPGSEVKAYLAREPATIDALLQVLQLVPRRGEGGGRYMMKWAATRAVKVRYPPPRASEASASELWGARHMNLAGTSASERWV